MVIVEANGHGNQSQIQDKLVFFPHRFFKGIYAMIPIISPCTFAWIVGQPGLFNPGMPTVLKEGKTE